MAEATFVAFIAVIIALSLIMIAAFVTVVLYVIVVEIRHWARKYRLRKARIEMRARALAGLKTRERTLRLIEKDRIFMENLRRAIDESP